jgi:hypothetical protein
VVPCAASSYGSCAVVGRTPAQEECIEYSASTHVRTDGAPWAPVPRACLADLQTLLEQPCTLCDHLALTPDGVDGNEDVSVALSAAGVVLFRAWLHQRGVDPLVRSS